MIKKHYLIICLFIFFQLSCKKETIIHQQTHQNLADATSYDAKIAIDWINQLRNIIRTQPLNPPRASRALAYAGITMYECIVDGIKDNKSLQGQLNGFAFNSIITNTDSLDYGIVINEAMVELLKSDTIIPNLSAQNLMNINAYYSAYLNSKSNVVDSIITKSKARGKYVASILLKYAAADQFLTIKTKSYLVPPRDMAHPWYWEPTDAIHLNPAEPYWGQVRPFVLDSAAQFEIPQTILFDSDTASAFGRQAREVLNTVYNRTVPQNDIVLWWRDGTGTQTPAGHWMGLLQYVIHAQNYKLNKAAELYALTGIATADAFISCWKSKYKYNLLRPETYIKAYIDAGFSTGQGTDPTPPFPEYPSGHSVCSGAADAVLTFAIGNFAFTDSVNTVSFGYVPRRFSNFTDAANEAGISRIYGGIHYMEAINSGLIQGRNIGQKINSEIRFK